MMKYKILLWLKLKINILTFSWETIDKAYILYQISFLLDSSSVLWFS